jgi:hypothetical protein
VSPPSFSTTVHCGKRVPAGFNLQLVKIIIQFVPNGAPDGTYPFFRFVPARVGPGTQTDNNNRHNNGHEEEDDHVFRNLQY